MADFTSPKRQREMAELLIEYFEPMGAKRFIVLGIDDAASITTLPVGWSPTEQLVHKIMVHLATREPDNKLWINAK